MGLSERIMARRAFPAPMARMSRTGANASNGRLAMVRAFPGWAVIAALACWTVPVQAAEVYRWIDERGVVNYSNEPPPKNATAKDVRVVEDRLSVYTPEKQPERVPPARVDKPAPGAGARATPPAPRVQQPPPPPVAYDPCANTPNDVNCYGIPPYDGPSVIITPRRPARLVQPELPPGTIAGQSAGSAGIIPGQSGTTPPAPASRSRKDEPSASFTLKDRDRERERDSRR